MQTRDEEAIEISFRPQPDVTTIRTTSVSAEAVKLWRVGALTSEELAGLSGGNIEIVMARRSRDGAVVYTNVTGWIGGYALGSVPTRPSHD